MTGRLVTEDNSGRIYCEAHAGGYLQAAMAKRPKAQSWMTPWGRIRVWTDELTAEFTAAGLTPACEDCGVALDEQETQP